MVPGAATYFCSFCFAPFLIEISQLRTFAQGFEGFVWKNDTRERDSFAVTTLVGSDKGFSF